ncbi:PKD domain-containing protein [Streptomyces erythrochromogenes]|uniref:PKD domain-containing protein n=1 Tax=Streptomyces erythrochromogenes TaxID=285574 RepID=UPI0037F11F53
MRPTRATALLTAGVVTLLGGPVGAAGAAETPANLYVSNHDGSNCSDAGTGTQAVPYCTISAAAKVVQPGQTVQIKPGKVYDEAVTIARSGEPGKPVSFVSEIQTGPAGHVQLAAGRGLTVTGASHVVLNKLLIRGGLQIKGSSDVELDRIHSRHVGQASLVVGEGSSNVRVSRGNLGEVLVNGGSRNTVLSRNNVLGNSRPAVAVADAPGTVVTNNTLYGYCAATLSVTGSSTASGIFNNVLLTESTGGACTSADPRNAVLVSQTAAAGTLADYNLLSAVPGLAPAPYSWSGTTYKDAGTFLAATGQGAHDISNESDVEGDGFEGSPRIDSADATAPGVLLTDVAGKPMVDDPLVPNTGKNGGYLDRGASELQDDLSRATVTVDPAHAPTGTEVQVQAGSDSRWPTTMSYQVDFGDGTAPVVTSPGTPHAPVKHAYSRPGDYVVKVTAVNGVGVKATAEKPVKVAPAGQGTADFTATQVLPPAGGSDAHVAPLTYAINASASVTPWPVARMEVNFGEGWSQSYDGLTAVQHTYAKPGAHEVTVKLTDIKGGTATTTRTVAVDYAPSGFVAPERPHRLTDTRFHGGAIRGGEPTVVRMPIQLPTSDHTTAGGMSSVVLNVTLTGATQDTHLSVSPTREDRPATSNVNVRVGGTTSNTVTVPVDKNGWVWMRLNSGQAHLIVDFVGHYQPNAGHKFSPIAPTRLADTRTAGGPLAGGTTRPVKVAGVNGIPADAKAVAVNLTSTGATSDSWVSAYPDSAHPTGSSNLNPEPGKDKSNQVIVPVGPNGTIWLYNNAGSTHLIMDAVGYYGGDAKALFTPVMPKRLADTRLTGKLAPGATTTVSGLPADAVGAVVNLTATETTGAGFLTAFGHGSARPEASSLNTLPGLTVPNHVTTPVGDGKVSVFNSWGGSNHVITDLLGYFTQD